MIVQLKEWKWREMELRLSIYRVYVMCDMCVAKKVGTARNETGSFPPNHKKQGWGLFFGFFNFLLGISGYSFGRDE